MTLDAKTIVFLMEKFYEQGIFKAILLFLIMLVLFIVAHGIARAFTDWASKKIFDGNGKKKKETIRKIKQSIPVNKDIQRTLIELRRKLGANIAHIFLYSNGESSVGGICYSYQMLKYEDVEDNYPSMKMSALSKISTTITHHISEQMFLYPENILVIDDVEKHSFPAKPIFLDLHFCTMALAAIETNGVTIGYVLLGWMYKNKQKPINKEELAEINNVRNKLSGYFQALEHIR